MVLKITLLCYDTRGFSSGLELFPWQLEVEHEDVRFATAEWSITADEEPKLARAYDDIATAIRRYGKLIDVKLFITGHTDTVGDRRDNAILSERRARAIAAYFRDRGVRVPIYYAGLGETALLVPTADDTEEARNRRARYIVTVNEPAGATWRRL